MIVLPETMRVNTIKWFRQGIGHTSGDRLQDMLRQCYRLQLIHQHIETFKCKDCQRYKIPDHGYGLLLKRGVQIAS